LEFILLYAFKLEGMEFQKHTLPNGIRLIHKQVDSPVAHCGLIINTGSRDESDYEHGITHLIEHLFFKGTKKRKAYHILSRMEDVGGELNAYTTKEDTCIYTTFFNNYYVRAFELICDIVFSSSFPEKEIVKEKEVIIDEINSYKDSPLDLIFDDFEELIFEENTIARNILGTEESLRKLNTKLILDYYKNNYATSQMIVSSVGKYSFEKIKGYFERYFSDIAFRDVTNKRIPVKLNQNNPFEKKVVKDTHQVHCIMGGAAYNYNHPERLTLHLLNNLLGGPGLNSKLNMILREKKGYAYNVESNYTAYSDTGIVSIYFGANKSDMNKCIDLIKNELKIMCNKALGTSQLSKAKKQLTGQIAISAENNESQMLSIGKSLLVYDKVDDLETICRKIDSITSSQIREVANEIFSPNNISILTYL